MAGATARSPGWPFPPRYAVFASAFGLGALLLFLYRALQPGGEAPQRPRDLPPLGAEDTAALDAALGFLSDPRPMAQAATTVEEVTPGESEILVATVCGNWYDPAKAPALAAAGRRAGAEIMLAGGIGRLTTERAEREGGEPLLLRELLVRSYGVRARSISMWTASVVTNHNLRAVLHYAKQLREFRGMRAHLLIIEEGLLVRRVAASIAALIAADAEARDAVAGVTLLPSGATSFAALAKLHRGDSAIAAALIMGEIDRLKRYAAADPSAGGRAQLPAQAYSEMGDSLRAALQGFVARHGNSTVAAGRRILEQLPREETLRLAAPLL